MEPTPQPLSRPRSAGRRRRLAIARGIRSVPALAFLVAVVAGDVAGAALPRLGGRLEGLGVVRLDHPSQRQRPLARIDLFAEQAITSRLRWKLSGTGRWGGTIENASGAGLIDFGHSFQNIDPSLELDEAWVEWLGDTLDLKVGNQVFTWGRLDGIKPNDQLNPFRYYDPLISDEIDTKIAVPAVAFSYYFPRSWRDFLPEESRVTLVWEPIDVPWLFPEQDERWFPPAAAPEPELFVPEGTVPCPCLVHVEQELRNSSPPARRFDNGNVGLRVSGRTSGVEWAGVYYDGYDPTPAFTVPIRLALDEATFDGEVFEVTALTQLRPAYLRYRSIGVDGSAVFGPVATRFEAAWRFRRPYPRDVRRLSDEILDDDMLQRELLDGKTVTLDAFGPLATRFEAAWRSRRPYPRDVRRLSDEILDDDMLQRELLDGKTVTLDAFVLRDAVEWGVGADYYVAGYLPLVELYQVILLHNDTPLLIKNVDTRLAASVRKSWLADRLGSELTGLWGIESGYELVRAELTYQVTDALEVRTGVLGIWGNDFSLIGEFNRNSEAYARIRYSF